MDPGPILTFGCDCGARTNTYQPLGVTVDPGPILTFGCDSGARTNTYQHLGVTVEPGPILTFGCDCGARTNSSSCDIQLADTQLMWWSDDSFITLWHRYFCDGHKLNGEELWPGLNTMQCHTDLQLHL